MPPSTLRVAAAVSLAGALAMLAAAGPAIGVQRTPVARVTCGAYDAVPSGVGDSGHPTRLSIQRGGRLLKTISDWRITRVECTDLDADGTPELLVTSDSGGAHCCETLRVWTLGARPTQALEYEAGHAAGFEARDLDGDGRLELIVGDDSFAFFDDLSYASSPSSLPLVACAAPLGFQECTARFPDLVRGWIPRFTSRLRLPGTDVELKDVEGAALGVLALSVLLGDEDAGLETIRRSVASEDVMRWLERARPKVRDWARTRSRKLKTDKK
jgi:hypothetical protein